MKTDQDWTAKKPLRQFLALVSTGLIRNWSMKYNSENNPNVAEFACVPSISEKDWLEAFEWNQINKRVISPKIGEITYALQKDKPANDLFIPKSQLIVEEEIETPEDTSKKQQLLKLKFTAQVNLL